MKVLSFIFFISIVTGCSNRVGVAPTPIIVTASHASAYEGRDGRTDALRDIAKGELQYIDCASSYLIGARTFLHWLNDRLGVSVVIAESMDETAFQYARAYNSEIMKAIDTKFGKGVIEQMWHEAEAFEKAHKEEANQPLETSRL